MSCNITRFIVKKLEYLNIPMESFYKSSRNDWHPEKEEGRDGTVVLRVMDASIIGVIHESMLRVYKIEWYGEGSGTGMEWILEPALKDSTGELIATCVWEGGKRINRLHVCDGVITWEDIEI